MDADHHEEVMRNIKALTTSARRLRVPILATEQYPKGLGHTLQEVKDTLRPGVEPIEKVSFSCCGVNAFRARLAATGTRDVVLTGIEAHVSVLMSAVDLLAAGRTVYVVADAVTSRTQGNWRLAMDQLRQGGRGSHRHRDRAVPVPGSGGYRGVQRAGVPDPLMRLSTVVAHVTCTSRK
jgi:nicotinamidase-related amidase